MSNDCVYHIDSLKDPEWDPPPEPRTFQREEP